MGDNGIRSRIYSDPYLSKRVDWLLDKGYTYRYIERVTGFGYRSVCRYAVDRPVKSVIPPAPKSELELELEADFAEFEMLQTRLTYERFHDTLKRYEQARGK